MISLSYLIDQVCSFEDALALKKIGVTQNSLHYWFYLSDSNISPKIALSGTNCLKDEKQGLSVLHSRTW